MTIKIFIGNISADTTSDNLRPLFEKYGKVMECDVLRTFGFVHMVDKNDANKAIAQLDGYSLDGNNIRVELSTGKKGSGGGGKFDRKGFGGPRGGRPYGPPPPRGDPRDFDRFPFPPLPPLYDRYDRLYHYYMEREREEYLAARLGGAGRDRLPPPRDLVDRFASDPRDRLPPSRQFMEERRGLGPDPFFRERDPIAARPPPEYYDRKPLLAGRGGLDSVGAAGAAGARGGAGFGGGMGGDYFRNDRGGASMGGASGGFGSGGRQGGGQNNFGGRLNGPAGMGGGQKNVDSQSSFATDPVFF